jgi:hypothetical protein
MTSSVYNHKICALYCQVFVSEILLAYSVSIQNSRSSRSSPRDDPIITPLDGVVPDMGT